ncbi:tRNA pseudouridine(55) synthase TruB [Treponema sp.]|uniref:tRNA pseudouridine(55) synthase TruB n=1 Tax=Treponema sp. TaxID=166 RepID=UPI00388ED2CC
MKKNNSEISGIVLLKKQPGITSFSSLSCVKRTFGTTKVGHTGTLDSFAEGLLVVLVGSLTHLVPHITNFDKTYEALIEFGTETDTLEPTGQIIKTGSIPSKENLESVLPLFLGETEQIPPVYSALHVDGKRASDLVREGKAVELASRKIKISLIKLLDFNGKFARIEVACSKGTYIRSLARDIALKCGTVAHLKELKRTRVGPFKLEDADESRLLSMTPELASLCGMEVSYLNTAAVSDFYNGRRLNDKMFIHDFTGDISKKEIAVFYPDENFAGVVKRSFVNGKKQLSYGFVIKEKQKMQIFSWEQILNGKFNIKFKEKGISLTIGSFDGSHLGHRSLFESVLSQKKNGLVPGVLTFTRSLRGYKNPGEYEGDVVSLSQKIENLTNSGFDFAIVVDFSEQFCKIEGVDFLSLLVNNCGLKYLAEGNDFHCGYKGSCGMEEIKKIASELDFSVNTVSSVIFEDERVSSSRIRKCVLERRFDLAQKMLLRPFELDCTGFAWKKTGEKSISAVKKGAQLMPPEGTYPVKVLFHQISQFSGEAQKGFACADCTLEKGNLRLAFSDNLISPFVKSVQFF